MNLSRAFDMKEREKVDQSSYKVDRTGEDIW